MNGELTVLASLSGGGRPVTAGRGTIEEGYVRTRFLKLRDSMHFL